MFASAFPQERQLRYNNRYIAKFLLIWKKRKKRRGRI